jgi:hypothetical protein
MDQHILNRRIDALLGDPMISLMLQADNVDRAGLARDLGALGRSVARRSISDKKPRAANWLPFALCGACAS